MPNPLTKPTVIRALMHRHGFSFNKALGQNFLINDQIPGKIADCAGLGADTCVLEIGPGIGTLSHELCVRAKKVLAVELDQRLAPILRDTLSGFDNFILHTGDALKTDLANLAAEHFGDNPFVVCANLPYYITSPLIMKLLEEKLSAQRITVMIQREVARRFCAAPGSADYGAITVSASYYAKAHIHFDVSPGSFMPPPKVTSTVISFTPISPPVTPHDPALMFEIIKAAFGQRRKTLCNALSNHFGAALSKSTAVDLLRSCGLSENVRGETLSLANFAQISDKIKCLKK